MQVLAWLIGVAAIGINVHAVVALVLGLRSRDAGTMARYARRCWWSVAAFVMLCVVASAASYLMGNVSQGNDPSARASRLAETISEALNCIAFVVLFTPLPAIAAAVLHLRAQRRER